MKPLLKIFTHPILIAALLGLVLAMIFPVKQSKYKVTKNEIFIGGQKKVFLRDVNHDGTFEKISVYYSDIMPRIGINTLDNKVYGEASLLGLIKPEDGIAFYDVNHDSTDEAYTLIRRGDSVFLAISELNLDANIRVKAKYLFSIAEVNGQPDWTTVSEYFFEDINKDGWTDVVFAYSALYSMQPRQIIAYDSKSDSILLSPVSGVKSYIYEISDYNSDGYPEIMLTTSTSENFRDTTAVPYHDHTPWLMVLDHHLRFVTQPQQFNVKPATFNLFSMLNRDTLLVAGYLNSFGTDKPSSALFIYNTDFNIIRKVKLALNLNLMLRGLIQRDGDPDLLYLFNSITGTSYLYDQELKLKEKIDLEPNTIPLTENKHIRKVNIDGKSFFVFQNNYTNPGFLFLDDAFHQAARIDYPESWSKDRFAHYQIYETKEEGVKFIIQTGSRLWEYDIVYDKFWYLDYWRYAAYLALMLGLVFLLQYLLKLRLEQKRKIENEILGLQLKSTLAQLDPHFTFNTLNMISGLIAADRREEANNYLVLFSRLMRATVMEGEKTMIPLGDELSFVRIYLEMQKIRTGNDFEYLVSVSEDVNPSMPIPKRIIHTHVENAVKHGLIHKEGSKRLQVEIMKSDKELCIEISDDGIGRENAGKINAYKSTGQGLRITRQILGLTGNLNHKKYTQEFVDLKDKEGKAAGTKIILKMEI